MRTAAPMRVLVRQDASSLRMKGGQHKQQYKDQSCRDQREICCFRCDIGENIVAHNCLLKLSDNNHTYHTWGTRAEFAMARVKDIFSSHALANSVTTERSILYRRHSAIAQAGMCLGL